MLYNADPGNSRAIGVSMTVRGIKAVLGAGISTQALDQCAEPIVGMAFCVGGRHRIRELTPLEGLFPLSLDRTAFQRLLNRHAALHEVKYYFEHKCLDVDLERKIVLIQGPDGAVQQLHGDLVIGADGAHSAVRRAMQSGVRRFEFKQSYFRHGYKTLVLPNAADLGFRRTCCTSSAWIPGPVCRRAAHHSGRQSSASPCACLTGHASLGTLNREAMADSSAATSAPAAGPPQEMTTSHGAAATTHQCPFQHLPLQGQILLIGDAAHATAHSSDKA